MKKIYQNTMNIPLLSVFQGSLPIYSSRVAVSVVDNVILVHQVGAKVVILYDLFLDSLAPISAPLPLLLRGISAATASSSQGSTRTAAAADGRSSSGYEGIMYGDAWTFLVPDLVCDTEHGLVWKLHLDLEVGHRIHVNAIILVFKEIYRIH